MNRAKTSDKCTHKFHKSTNYESNSISYCSRCGVLNVKKVQP